MLVCAAITAVCGRALTERSGVGDQRSAVLARPLRIAKARLRLLLLPLLSPASQPV